MKIHGIEGVSVDEIQREIDRGARFVMYHYCISILILTFRRPSEVYFVRFHESRVAKGLKFTIISFLLGWWGIPWGPIYTIGSIVTNFSGGKDVTQPILASLQQSAPSPTSSKPA